MKDFSKEIKAYALQNSIEFGKADAGRILPKLFQHGLDKKDIAKIMPVIQEIVKNVNAMSKEVRQEEFDKLQGLVKKREEKEKDLPELKNVSGKVITRIPPEPSKYLHVGHALSFLLNYIYSQRYDGKCLVRMEDANPEKVSKEYVDNIIEDLGYLEIPVGKPRFVSDDMKIMYDYAEKLVKMEKAYVCFCDREKMQKLRFDGIECECRDKSLKVNLEEWKKMLAGKYDEGECVLRIKGNMQSKNHVMRDSVIFRIVNQKHFRQGSKYKVWPMYDFYNPIEDSLMGVTHILRSNEFEMRVELHDYLKDLLGLSKQTVMQYGRFNVIDATTKGREIREMIASGEFIGWDDPRLVTLKALRRRGIKKEVLYELVKQLGLNKKEAKIDFDMIAAISRKLIDKETERYYFVKDAVELEIKNMPVVKEAEIPIHPDKPEKRKVRINKIFVSKEDLTKLRGKEARLLHLFNIKFSKTGNKAEFTSMENKNVQKIQWVSEGLPAKVMMPNGKFISGLAESSAGKLKVDQVIQFERFGFVRLDKKSPLEFWFSHE